MNDPDEVTLTQWAEEAKRRIDIFVEWWLREVENPENNPEDWPLAMPAGEWDEQYRCSEGG